MQNSILIVAVDVERLLFFLRFFIIAAADIIVTGFLIIISWLSLNTLLTSGPSKISAKRCEKSQPLKVVSQTLPQFGNVNSMKTESLGSLGLRVKSYMDSTTARNLLLLAATSMRSWTTVVHLRMLSLVSGIMGSKSIPKTVSYPEISVLAQPHWRFRIELTSPRYLVPKFKRSFPFWTSLASTLFITCFTSLLMISTEPWSLVFRGLPVTVSIVSLISPFQHTHSLFSCELRTIISVKDVWISNQSKETRL